MQHCTIINLNNICFGSKNSMSEKIKPSYVEFIAALQMPRQLMFCADQDVLSNMAYPVYPNNFGPYGGYGTWPAIVEKTYKEVAEKSPTNVYFHGSKSESEQVKSTVKSINQEHGIALAYEYVAADIPALTEIASEKLRNTNKPS